MRTGRSAALAALPRRILAVCVTALLATGGVAVGGDDGRIQAGRVPPGPSGDAQPAASPTPAQLVLVTNCDNAGVGSLRWAAAFPVGAAGTVDLRQLTCSKITLTSGPVTTSVTHLTLVGPGRDALTIDGNGNGLVLDADSLDVIDLTIANGANADGDGGCIRTVHDLDLVSSTVTGCRAGDGSNATAEGGGVHVGHYLTMSSSRISQCEALAVDDASGGGAWAGQRAYLYGSTIAANHARAMLNEARGGGLFAEQLALVIGSSLTENTAESGSGVVEGGAISVDSLPGMDLNRSTISGNTAHSDTAPAYGGGISSHRSISMLYSRLSDNTVSSDCADCTVLGGGAHSFQGVYITDSTVSGNRAQSATESAGNARGGGLSTRAGGDKGLIAVRNSTVSGNSAIGGAQGAGAGGGFANAGMNVIEVDNSTIAFNHASSSGGGFACGSASLLVNLRSAIMALNEAPDGSDIGCSFQVQVTGDHGLIGIVSDGVILPPDTLRNDPKLLPLTGNGGPTPTHALADCSPALDVGSNPNGYTHDQRGAPYLRVYGVAADIGAFELQPDPDFIFANGFDLRRVLERGVGQAYSGTYAGRASRGRQDAKCSLKARCTHMDIPARRRLPRHERTALSCSRAGGGRIRRLRVGVGAANASQPRGCADRPRLRHRAGKPAVRHHVRRPVPRAVPGP